MMNVVTTKTRKWAVVATQTTDVVGGLRGLRGGPDALRGRLPDERPTEWQPSFEANCEHVV
jgi:hypothetical protein